MSPHRANDRPSIPVHRGRRPTNAVRSIVAVALLAVLVVACSPEPDADLGAEWTATEIADVGDVAFVLPVPPQGATWRPGDDDAYAELAVAAAGTDWWRFWAPRLEGLTAETSNVRAMAAGADDGELYAIQVNRSAYDLDVDPDDAAAIGEAFGSIAIAQGSELTEVRTVTVDGFEVDEVAEVAFTVDPEVLDRDVWQRIVPVPTRDELWSIQCDAPSGTEAAANCQAALDAFAFTF